MNNIILLIKYQIGAITALITKNFLRRMFTTKTNIEKYDKEAENNE